MILRIDDVITSKAPKGGPGGQAECPAVPKAKNKHHPNFYKITVRAIKRPSPVRAIEEKVTPDNNPGKTEFF